MYKDTSSPHPMRFLLPLLLLFCLACGRSAEAPGAADGPPPAALLTEQRSPDLDFAGRGQVLTFETPADRTGSAYVVKSDTPSQQYILLFHEWWGLTNGIKREAERYFDRFDDVNVIALDLYDGELARTAAEAQQLVARLTPERALDIVRGALDYLGPDARVVTVGWDTGAYWALRTAVEAGDRAKGCVMYYGEAVTDARDLVGLEAPVLYLVGELDDFVSQNAVERFVSLGKALNKDIAVSRYPAAHNFANTESPRYNEAAARRANLRVMQFVAEVL